MAATRKPGLVLSLFSKSLAATSLLPPRTRYGLKVIRKTTPACVTVPGWCGRLMPEAVLTYEHIQIASREHKNSI